MVANREVRAMGMSMTQSPQNYDIVEHVLTELGGQEGFAVATLTTSVDTINQN